MGMGGSGGKRAIPVRAIFRRGAGEVKGEDEGPWTKDHGRPRAAADTGRGQFCPQRLLSLRDSMSRALGQHERGGMDEAEAIARLKAGDIAGLEALVELHQVEAVQAAVLVTRDRDMAEDVVQAAYLRLRTAIRGFDAARPFRPWFMRLVVHDAIKAAVRQGRDVALGRDEVGDYEGALRQLAQNPREPEDVLERQELVAAMRKAIARLSPSQRAAVVARYYSDLSTEEAAGRLNCAPGTLRWHLSQARARLRTMLDGFK